MADGLVYSFDAVRNEDYLRVWKMNPGGEDLQIAGWFFVLNFAPMMGGPAVLSVGIVPSTKGSKIAVEDGLTGAFSVFIAQEDLAALPGGSGTDVLFAFNLVAMDTAGIRRADVRGIFTLHPGV